MFSLAQALCSQPNLLADLCRQGYLIDCKQLTKLVLGLSLLLVHPRLTSMSISISQTSVLKCLSGVYFNLLFSVSNCLGSKSELLFDKVTLWLIIG